MASKGLVVGLALGAAFAASQAQAALPSTLNYQGRVRLSGGAPVPDSNGNTAVFRICANATCSGGSDPLWTETWNSGTAYVSTQAGLFNVILGTHNPINLPFDQPYYLEVNFNNDGPMAPRQPLTMAPYAYRARFADSVAVAAPLTLTAAVPANGAVLTVSNSGFGLGIYGQASGSGVGIYGSNSSSPVFPGISAGLMGYASNSSGRGVYGQGATNFSAGVQGHNTHSGQDAYGVVGTGLATDGAGVVGTTQTWPSVPGLQAGVYGISHLPGAVGVYARNTGGGEALRVSGNARFTTGSVTFVAHVDFSGATVTGLALGGVGVPLSLTLNSAVASPLSVSNAGGAAALAQGLTGLAAVGAAAGIAASGTGPDAYAVFAQSNSTKGTLTGVNFGGASGVLGANYAAVTGVSGVSGFVVNGSDGSGVFGLNNSPGNTGAGVKGENGSASGYGVLASNPNGTAFYGTGVTGVVAVGSALGLSASSALIGGNLYPTTVGAAGQILMAAGGGNIGWAAAPNGDITEVYAGNGLLGGGTFGAASLSVNAGTGANQIVQLNGTAQLPGVSGALLTNLPPPAAPLSLTLGASGAPFYGENSGSGPAIAARNTGTGVGISATAVGLTSVGGHFQAVTGLAGIGTHTGLVARGSAFGISATATTAGTGIAIYATGSSSFNGQGVVMIRNTASSPNGAGLFAQAGNQGSGVHGSLVGSPPVLVTTAGVYGSTNGATGVGVLGRNDAGVAIASSGFIGVSSASSTGLAYYGVSSALSPTAELINLGGGPALRLGGSAFIDSSTNTITMASYVSFAAGTNLSAGGVSAPLSLTLNAANAAPLYVSNTGGGNGISVTANGSGPAGAGVYAVNAAGVNKIGVYGQGTLALMGSVSAFPVMPTAASVAVYGFNGVGGTAIQATSGPGAGKGMVSEGGSVGLSASASSASGQAVYGWASSNVAAAQFDNAGSGPALSARNNSSGIGLTVTSDSGYAIYAQSGAGPDAGHFHNLGSGLGLWAASEGSHGIWGRATTNGVGVIGAFTAGSPTIMNGTGVQGYSPAASGYGVVAQASGAGGIGLSATASSSTGYAGHFQVNGANAYGVYAYNYAPAGQGTAVYGASGSSNGTAMWGEISNVGANNAVGVYGAVVNGNGANMGVKGASNLTNGVGVSGAGGKGVVGEGQAVGVSATASSASGYAFYGQVFSSASAGYFRNNGSGAGVYGESWQGGAGVKGTAMSSPGSAIHALNVGGSNGPTLLVEGGYTAVSITTNWGNATKAIVGRSNSANDATAQFINDSTGSPLKLNSYSFPIGGGSAGEVLTSDGIGQLYWAAGGGASAPLSLTLNSAVAAPLAVSNASGVAISATAGSTGVAIYGVGAAIGATGVVAVATDGVALHAHNQGGGGFRPSILAVAQGTNHAVEARNTNGGALATLAGSPSFNGTGVYGRAGAFSFEKGVFGEAAQGYGVMGTGLTGVAGVVTATGQIGLLGDGGGIAGSLALRTVGDARFDGIGNTATFNIYVSFTAGTNLGSSLPNPLSLTNAAGSPIYGNYTGASNVSGIYGYSNNGYGVWGQAAGATAGRAGVFGGNDGFLTTQGWGVHGSYIGGQALSAGVMGQFGASVGALAGLTNGAGVVGLNDLANGVGAYGRATSASGYGLFGLQTGGGGGAGVLGTGSRGVVATGSSIGLSATAAGTGGVAIWAQSSTNVGNSTAFIQNNGTGYAVSAVNQGTGPGLYAQSQGSDQAIVAESFGASLATVQARGSALGLSVTASSTAAIAGHFQATTAVVAAGRALGLSATAITGPAIVASGNSANAAAVKVVNFSPSNAIGLMADVSPAGPGIGVFGTVSTANLPAGLPAVGVVGATNMGPGWGVYGRAVAGTGVVGFGQNFGISATASAANGEGGYFAADAIGVHAVSNCCVGSMAGLFEGGTIGISVTAAFNNGNAIYAHANSSNPTIWAGSSDPNGEAVYGENYAGGRGGHFISMNNHGVEAWNNNGANFAAVMGDAGGGGANRVYGTWGRVSTNNAGSIGVLGTYGNPGPTPPTVFGGAGAAGAFLNNGPNGYGVFASATGTGGVALAVSGAVRAWKAVLTTGAAFPNPGALAMGGSLAPSGKIINNNITPGSLQNITITGVPACTVDSTVMISLFGNATPGNVGYTVWPSNGSFVIKFTAAQAIQQNGGLNYFILNQ